MSAKFILKRRDFTGMGRCNPYRPRGQATFGPWQVVSVFDTILDAHDALLSPVTGLCERAVFYRGRRVTDESQRILAHLIERLA